MTVDLPLYVNGSLSPARRRLLAGAWPQKKYFKQPMATRSSRTFDAIIDIAG
ncbi:hypothetical protein J6590_078391 [Homalodisca vitripennis]|nr:hypothetical protein J6590_078391 [Homalodisca vitripennis]